MPPLDAIRPQVEREWENARRECTREESYRRSRSRYEVAIEANVPVLARTKP